MGIENEALKKLCKVEHLDKQYVESYIKAGYITADGYLALTPEQRQILNHYQINRSITEGELSLERALRLTQLQATQFFILNCTMTPILSKDQLDNLSSEALDIIQLPGIEALIGYNELTIPEALKLSPWEQQILQIPAVSKSIIEDKLTIKDALKFTLKQQEILKKEGVRYALSQNFLTWKEATNDITIKQGELSLTQDKDIEIEIDSSKFNASLIKLLNTKLTDLYLYLRGSGVDNLLTGADPDIKITIEKLLDLTDDELNALLYSPILRYCIKQKFITVEDIGNKIKITKEEGKYVNFIYSFSLKPEQEITIGKQNISLERFLNENSEAREEAIKIYEHPVVLALLEGGTQIDEIFEFISYIKSLDVLEIDLVKHCLLNGTLKIKEALELTSKQQDFIQRETISKLILENKLPIKEVLTLTSEQQDILAKEGVYYAVSTGLITWKEAIEEIQTDVGGKLSLTKDKIVELKILSLSPQVSMKKLLNTKLENLEGWFLQKDVAHLLNGSVPGVNLSIEKLLSFNNYELGALCDSHILRYCLKQEFITVEDIGTKVKITGEKLETSPYFGYIFSLDSEKKVTIGGQEISLARLLNENSRAKKGTIELYENPDILLLLQTRVSQIDEIFEPENSTHRTWEYQGPYLTQDKALLKLVSEGIAGQKLTLKQVLNLSPGQRCNLIRLEREFRECIEEKIFTLEDLLLQKLLPYGCNLHDAADRKELKKILDAAPRPPLADAFKTLDKQQKARPTLPHEQQNARITLLHEQRKAPTEAEHTRKRNARDNNNSSSLAKSALLISGSLTISFLIMGGLSWYKKLPESMNNKTFAVSMLIAGASCAVFCIGLQVVQAIFNNEENKVPTQFTGNIETEAPEAKEKS